MIQDIYTDYHWLRAMASDYAEYGWAVLLIEEQGKVPATRHGVKDATRNLDQIAQWWTDNPRHNVAIATGEPSGIVVVDVDGPEGMANLRALVDGKPLPKTAAVRTPRGVHLYFQSPEGGLGNSASKLAPGIDVRGDGGYVLAPPSINDAGEEYRWLRTTLPAPFPEDLLERLKSESPPLD